MKGVPNNWIAVDCDIDDDDKTKAVARASGLTLNECVGAVVRVLGRMRRKAPKGDLSGIPDDDINAWAGFDPGHPFAAHFVGKFCDGTRKSHSWMAYNGRMLEKSKRDVKRIRKYRARKKKERRDGTPNVTRNVPRTFRKRSASPNPTQPNPSGVGDGGGAAGGALSLEGSGPLPEVKALSLVLGTPNETEREAIRKAAGLDR